jgi:hypothetical protein
MRKFTRILFKSFRVLLYTIIILVICSYFAIRSHKFQTWLGNKATAYLSKELKSKVYVEKIELDFFSKANLQGVMILDKKNDTLLCGNVGVDIRNFSYKNQSLTLKKISLQNATAKVIQYKNDSSYNFQFLIDYFDSGSKKDTTTKKGWDIKFGDVVLSNVNFTLRNEHSDTKVSNTMNFDNLAIKNINGKISDFKIDNETMYANIFKLTANEQSGFTLNNLTTRAKISPKELLLKDLVLQTPLTNINGELHFTYESWDDYQDFLNKIKINSTLTDNTKITLNDIAHFAPELEGLNETVFISGKVEGLVSDLYLKRIDIRLKDHTAFKGNLSISGLPDFNNSFLHFDADQLSTNYTDLVQIPDYPFNKNKKLELPLILKSLGTINYKGKFDGFVTDFTTYGKFTTSLGNLQTDLSIKLDSIPAKTSYHGKLKTSGFNIGALAGVNNLNNLNNLTMNAQVKGKGISLASLDAAFDGNIATLNYNGYTYKNIQLNGEIKDRIFNGLVLSKDPNANFDFNGNISFQNALPEMDFIATINALNFSELKLVNKLDSGILSSQVLIILKGNSIDNLSGEINFDDTQYKTKTKKFKLSTFDLKLDQSGTHKVIKLSSAYANAILEGEFLLSNLQPAFKSFLNNYYPKYIKTPSKQIFYNDAATFNITIKNFKTINELFLPDVMLSAGTNVNGTFDASIHNLNLNGFSSKLEYQKNIVPNLSFKVTEEQSVISAVVKGDGVKVKDSLYLDNFNLCLSSQNSTTKYDFEWDNLKTPVNKGSFIGSVNLNPREISISYDTIVAILRDSSWHMVYNNPTVIDTAGNVLINPLLLVNNNQSIGLAGIISKRPQDTLQVNLQNLALQQFNPILSAFKLQLEGRLNGDMKLFNALGQSAFAGNVDIEGLKLNNNLIGKLVAKADLNPADKSIFLDGYTTLGLSFDMANPMKNLTFNGYYFLDKKENNLDFKFGAKPINLKLLNPFLTNILTINNALINGDGTIKGSPADIKVEGNFKLFKSEIKVDYTNVTYNIVGDVEIMPDQIRFSDLVMNELNLKGIPQGTLNGNIFHRNFEQIQLDYDISYRKMLVLNTTEKDNGTFYGKVYGSGNVGIYGFVNNLHMQIIDTTTKNSKFFLPLDGPTEIGENNFIRFVKLDTVNIVEDKKLTGFDLDMRLNLTPEAVVQIILDKKNGDVLNAQGFGDLGLQINTLGKFEMFGDYILTNGDYNFTLENVINKKFQIVEGSSISWSGNPLNADINVTTSYRQRVSIAPLINDTVQYSARVPVDLKLNITGKLFTPVIDFNLDVQNIDATAQSRITNILSDEAELNRQVFSFLLFRSFVTPQIFNSGGGGVNAGTAAASTSSEMLSNRASEFINNYFGNLTGIKDLNLGVNYRPGSNNSQAVDLALSKQFLNNKVSVDGNFGVNNNTTTNSNGLIGDVNVDYKLTDDGRYRLRGFNRSNDVTQLTTSGGLFTQGVGVFYRKEFDSFNFRLKKNKKNEEEGKK